MTGKAWFFTGIGCGALAGILCAPHSGDETRQTLRVKAKEGRRYIGDRTQQVRERAGHWADRSRQAIDRQKENLRGAMETGRQAYREATTRQVGTGF